MILISFFTKLLHLFPSEIAHHIALKGLKLLYKIGVLKLFMNHQEKSSLNPLVVNTKELKNKIGIAAGLDKNGDYIDCLSALGVGFIEVGTITPKPQQGNPKPRLFRDKKNRSLLNRLGFNNKGVEYLVTKLKCRKSNVVVGASIGKNYDTPNRNAYKDYLFCFN